MTVYSIFKRNLSLIGKIWITTSMPVICYTMLCLICTICGINNLSQSYQRKIWWFRAQSQGFQSLALVLVAMTLCWKPYIQVVHTEWGHVMCLAPYQDPSNPRDLWSFYNTGFIVIFYCLGSVELSFPFDESNRDEILSWPGSKASRDLTAACLSWV